MKNLRKIRIFLSALVLAFTVSACSSKPPARLYLLDPVFDLKADSPAENVHAIGLSVVVLPGYANDQRIASRGAGARVVFDDDNKWADSPDEAITRVLAQRLQDFAGANVLIEPWPRGFEPQARVEVVFDRLLRESTGGAEMAGQIRITSGDARSVIAVNRFRFIHYADSRDPSDFFGAVSAGVNDVARMITGHMLEL